MLVCFVISIVNTNERLHAETNSAAVYKAAANSITVDELKSHIEFLASDSLEGREAGRGNIYPDLSSEAWDSTRHG